MVMPFFGVVSARADSLSPSSQLNQAATLDLPSIVLVISDEAGWLRAKDGSVHGPYDMSYMGTGFFISSDGYIVTAAHVAAPTATDVKTDLVDSYIDDQYNCDPTTAQDECAGVEADHEGSLMRQMTPFKTSVQVSVLTQDQDGTSDGVPATVAASSPPMAHDVAVIKISGKNEPVSIMGSGSATQPGDGVSVLGYPASTENSDLGYNVVPTVTSGHILGHLRGNSDSPAAQKAALLEIDAAIEEGDSGGPGISGDGSVDGIVSFGDIGSNDNYLVSADDVKAVVAQTPAKNQLGPIDILYRLALATRGTGNTQLAIRLFDACAALNPVQVYCAGHGSAATPTYTVALKSTNHNRALLAHNLSSGNNPYELANVSLEAAVGALALLALIFRIGSRQTLFRRSNADTSHPRADLPDTLQDRS